MTESNQWQEVRRSTPAEELNIPEVPDSAIDYEVWIQNPEGRGRSLTIYADEQRFWLVAHDREGAPSLLGEFDSHEEAHAQLEAEMEADE